MKKLFTYLFLLLNTSAMGQNFVPNPSFEDTLQCPDNLDQIYKADGWSSYGQSPDYFNTCADSISSVAIPLNFSGYHYARTGNAYGGFIIGQNYREFVGVELNQLLDSGLTYYVSFYVCRGGNINRNRASNKIGIHLSTVSYSSAFPAPVNNVSQVYTDSVISDTVTWTKISGSFIADSAYQFLSIGNFFQDSLTTYLSFDSIHLQCYYYLEDVILSPDSNCCTGYDLNLHNNPDGIKIFPNPASKYITVNGNNISKLALFNVLGEICFTSNVLSDSFNRINITDLRANVYFLHIQTSKQNIIRKIIIQ